MHLVTITEPISRGQLNLPVGSYLADNVNAGEMLSRSPSTVRVQEITNPKPLGNAPCARVLIIRAGGFGDLLFLAAAIRVFKQTYPGAHIAVACFPVFAEALEHNPDVAEVITYPVSLATAETFDVIVPLENTVEEETELHAVDRYLDELGFDSSEIADVSKRCVYHLTDKESAAAHSAFPQKLDEKSNPVPRLGVQVVASAMARTYPHDQLAQACEMLHRRGWEIFFFGQPHSLNIEERERIVNLSLRGLNFRQSCAVLSTCDVVLAPDSSLCHVAGALDLPTVALYGPFPWKLRTRYHAKTFALSGEGPCAPCFHRSLGREHFPEDGPCRKTGRCEVLASIKPGRVAAKIDALYKASVQIAEHRAAGKSVG